jgi:DNA-directed RNA polymerase omega subunit
MEERIPEKVDSKFRYVLGAATRAELIIRGSRPRIDQSGKPTRVAMEEISHNMVDWDYGPAPSDQPAPGEEGVETAAEEVEEVH